jgi:fatty acid kinase fatty acid binding subunit
MCPACGESSAGGRVRMVKVVTDSTADIPAHLVAELGISVIPTYVIFGTETYRDGVDLTRQQFYRKLSASRTIPTTAAPPPAVYEQVYRRLADETEEILSIHLLSRYSGLYSSAALAASNVSEARIEVIDSGQVTMGYGWMVVAAAEAARRGETLEGIRALVEGMKPRSRVLAILDTFEYLYRGGRVGWVRSMIGTVLRIKPMIEVRLGEVQLVERARTLERSAARLLERVRALEPLERAIVLHANAADTAERLADQLQAILPAWDRLIDQAGVTIATHTGPGAVGIACVTAK